MKKELIIDATSVSTRISGIERYTKELVFALLETVIEEDYNITILTAKDAFWIASNVKNIKILNSRFNSKLLTQQLWIPYLSIKARDSFFFFPGFPPSPFVLLFKKGKKIIRTMFDAAMWMFPETLSTKNKLYMRPFEEYGVKYYDLVVTISESSRQDLINIFPRVNSKISNIGIGLSEHFYVGSGKSKEVVRNYQEPGELKTLLFVGTIEPRKNLIFLIEILSSLIKKGNNLQLFIVGRKGWGNIDLHQKAVELGITKELILSGAVSDEELKEFYQKADVFIYPSLYEGFGLPVIEAMNMGIPVISSNSSSLPEACGDAAILLPPGNVDSWVEAVEKLLSDSQLRNKMREKGFKNIEQFTWENVAYKFWNMLGAVGR